LLINVPINQVKKTSEKRLFKAHDAKKAIGLGSLVPFHIKDLQLDLKFVDDPRCVGAEL